MLLPYNNSAIYLMTAVTKPVVALLLLATQSDMSGLFSNTTKSECTLNIAINMHRNNVENSSVAVTPAIKKRRLVFDDDSCTD